MQAPRLLPLELLFSHEVLIALTTAYSNAARISVQIMGPDCAPLADHVSVQRPHAFCEEYVWKPVDGRQDCFKSNRKAVKKCKAENLEVTHYRCHCKLMDFVAPVVSDAGLHGYVFGGQVRTNEHDLDDQGLRLLATQKARKYCPKEKRRKYIEGFIEKWRAIPLLSEREIGIAETHLVHFAQCLARLANVTPEYTASIERPLTLQDVERFLNDGYFAKAEDAWRWTLCLGLPRVSATLYEVVEREKNRVLACRSVLRHRSYARFPDHVGRAKKPDHHVWRVLDGAEPEVIENSTHGTILDGNFVRAEGFKSSYARVLTNPDDGKQIGVLFLNFRTKKNLDSDTNRQKLTQVSRLIERTLLHRIQRGSLEEQNRLLEAVFEASRNVIGEFKTADVLERVLSPLGPSIGIQQGCVRLYLYSHGQGRFREEVVEYTREGCRRVPLRECSPDQWVEAALHKGCTEKRIPQVRDVPKERRNSTPSVVAIPIGAGVGTRAVFEYVSPEPAEVKSLASNTSLSRLLEALGHVMQRNDLPEARESIGAQFFRDVTELAKEAALQRWVHRTITDCAAMKRRIQQWVYEETKDMTAEELAAYLHNRIAKSQFATFLDRPVDSPNGTTIWATSGQTKPWARRQRWRSALL